MCDDMSFYRMSFFYKATVKKLAPLLAFNYMKITQINLIFVTMASENLS